MSKNACEKFEIFVIWDIIVKLGLLIYFFPQTISVMDKVHNNIQ